MTVRGALARAVVAGPHVTAEVPPGQQTPPTVPGGTTSFTYNPQTGARPLAMLGLAGGGGQVAYPGGGIVLVPDPDAGVMKVMAWWPDATGLLLMRHPFGGDRALVRGGSPLPVTQSTRRNWSTNPSAETNTTGYTAGTGSPAISQVARTDSVGGMAVRATIASAGTCEVALPGTLPGGVAVTVGADLKFSATPATVTFTATWLTSTGGAAGTTSVALTAAQIVYSVGQFYRQVGTMTPPVNGASATVKITATGLPAGGQMEIDLVTLESASTSGSYVDGDILGGQWLGTAELSASVIAPVVTLSDGECPFDLPVYYTLSNPSITGGWMASQEATLDSRGQAWLTHPASPGSPVTVRVLGDMPDLVHSVEQGIFPILDSPFPVVVSATRQAPSGSIEFYAETFDERDALLDMFGPGVPVLLRVPADARFREDWWIVLGSIVEAAMGGKTYTPGRSLSAPFQIVEAPSGTSVLAA